VSPAQIALAVSHLYGINVRTLLKPHGHRKYRDARRVAMWCCRVLTDGTHESISQYFGRVTAATCSVACFHYEQEVSLLERVRTLNRVIWWPDRWVPPELPALHAH
jgi:chromosomal replication initiation ATPase DnaA